MTTNAVCNPEEYSTNPATLASQVRWLYYGDCRKNTLSGAGGIRLAAHSQVVEDEVSHIPNST